MSTQIERFENLVRVLDQVAQDGKMVAQFDLDDWFSLYKTVRNKPIEDALKWEDMFTNDDPELMKIPDMCGTTACACGFAGLDPWFRKQGFKTTFHGELKFVTSEVDEEHFEAVEEFFGIDEGTAMNLFYPDHYRHLEDGGSLANVRARVAAFLDILKQQG